jgi:nucleotide-binding universal stress UspA family protein
MSTATLLAQPATSTALPKPAAEGPLLLASDGSDDTAQAMIIARQLASRSGAEVELISVLEPLNVLVPAPEMVPPPEVPGLSRIDGRRARLEQASSRALGQSPKWSTRILIGSVARTIAGVARDRGARLVVTGLVRHGRIDRALRRETPLGVVQSAGVPVLAVPRTMKRLPRCIVIAIGEGDAGAHLGEIALPLLSEAEVVHLVHVRKIEPLYDRPSRDADARYEREMQRIFADVQSFWHLPVDVPVRTHILAGRSVDELLDFAEDADADLLVVGFSPRSLLHNMSAGIGTRLYRGSSCAVLLVPESHRGRVSATGTTTVVSSADEWPALLSAFVHRNAGRSASLEVDDEALGAQMLVHAFHLLGVEIQQRLHSLTITLGDAVSRTTHITHRVALPTVIAVHRTPEGRDDALVVEYDGGQLLLTLR